MKVNTFLFLLCLPILASAQNLVPNGSFEDTSNCGHIGQPCDPAGWLYIRKASTNGYAHMLDGIQAFNGDRKLCFTVGNKYAEKRTYWETTLLEMLQKGSTYKLTMYIHGWDDPPNLNDLGVLLMDSLFFVDTDTVLQPNDYIDILHAKVKQEKNGWFKIEREIIPDRNVRYMLVGNFSPKDYQKVAQGRYSRSFYICDFIDDIRIEPIVKRPCPDCQRTRDSIYLVSQQLFSDQRLAPPKPVATAKVEVRKIDTVELPSLLFELNSSKMLDSSVLDQYKSIFLDTGIQRIVVAGYTDSTGGKEYNSALAANRAQAVAEQIGKRFGITPGIIEQTGRGISYKYAEMDKNRRVEIYIYRK